MFSLFEYAWVVSMTMLSLEGFMENERDVVMRLLQEAAKEPDIHFVRMSQLPPPPRNTGEWAYGVGFKSGRNAQTTSRYTREPIKDALIARGFASIISPGDSMAFAFTEEAFAWYQAQMAPSESEVRKSIGSSLYHEFLDDADHGLEAAEISERTGIDQTQVKRQLRVLAKLEHAEEMVNPGSFIGSTALGSEIHWLSDPSATRYTLQSPEGVRWAAAGFPEISYGQSTNLSVTVVLTLQQAVQQVEALPISEDDKARFERILRRFEEEGAKEAPSYKPLQDGLDMLSKVTALWPVGFKFFTQNLDTIERMARHVTGM